MFAIVLLFSHFPKYRCNITYLHTNTLTMLERAVMHAWWTHSCNVVLTEWECCMCHLCPIFHSWAFVCLRDLLRVRECVFVCVWQSGKTPLQMRLSVFKRIFVEHLYLWPYGTELYTHIHERIHVHPFVDVYSAVVLYVYVWFIFHYVCSCQDTCA